jgi:hypothetical protein
MKHLQLHVDLYPQLPTNENKQQQQQLKRRRGEAT